MWLRQGIVVLLTVLLFSFMDDDVPTCQHFIQNLTWTPPTAFTTTYIFMHDSKRVACGDMHFDFFFLFVTSYSHSLQLWYCFKKYCYHFPVKKKLSKFISIIHTVGKKSRDFLRSRVAGYFLWILFNQPSWIVLFFVSAMENEVDAAGEKGEIWGES